LFWKGYAALKHVIAEAETYGVDTERIALTGGNAGGYTAQLALRWSWPKKMKGGL
jgi:acetyl esterase/lipase